jgi:hypothetical protein
VYDIILCMLILSLNFYMPKCLMAWKNNLAKHGIKIKTLSFKISYRGCMMNYMMDIPWFMVALSVMP